MPGPIPTFCPVFPEDFRRQAHLEVRRKTASYRSSERLFRIVANGSSHRGEAAKKRLRQVDSRIILVHTPVHASWLNQVEIYFSNKQVHDPISSIKEKR